MGRIAGVFESKEAWRSKVLNSGFINGGTGVESFEKFGWSGGNEEEVVVELALAWRFGRAAAAEDKRFGFNIGIVDAAAEILGWIGGKFEAVFVGNAGNPRLDNALGCNIDDKPDSADKPVEENKFGSAEGLAVKFGWRSGNAVVEGCGNNGKVGLVVFVVDVVGKIGKPAAAGNNEESADKFGSVVEAVVVVVKAGFGKILTGPDFLSFLLDDDDGGLDVEFELVAFGINGLGVAPVESIGNCKAVNMANGFASGLANEGNGGLEVVAFIVGVIVGSDDAVFEVAWEELEVFPTLAYFLLLLEEVLVFDVLCESVVDVKDFEDSFFNESISFLVDSKSVINFDMVLLEFSVERLTAELDFFSTDLVLLVCVVDTSDVVLVLPVEVLVPETLLFEVLVPGRDNEDNNDR